MNLLAVDLGSAYTGAARFEKGELLWARAWKIERKRRKRGAEPEHQAERWSRLQEHLRISAGARPALTHVAYEKVQVPAKGLAAGHAYGACEAILALWCHGLGLTPIEINTSTVKRAATGKGGGPGTAKADILAAAKRRWPHIMFGRHDAADAAFVGLAALGRCQ